METNEKRRKKRNTAKERGADISLQNRFKPFTADDPDLVWCVGIKYPFSYSLSKNAVWRTNGKGHVFLRKESNAARAEIALMLSVAIRKSGIRVARNKLWVELLVEKPSARGDAINVVDLVCDAIKDVVFDTIDDNWFSIKKLDWAIVKHDPYIHIKIGQESNEDASICSYCGRILSVDMFGTNTVNKANNGLRRECFECRNVKKK